VPAYTPQQQAALAAEGDVVVVAGAGAGKTRVLVDRLLDRALRPAGAPGAASLDRVLVVTFTEAAAAEMRRRLADGLVAAVAARPEDPRPAEQLALLPAAAIGTIHSFCLRLVRGHFHALDLDPQLAVLDDAAAGRLAREAFERVLTPHSGADGPESAAVRGLRRGWFDGERERLEDAIRGLHRLARTLPDADAWLAARRAECAAGQPCPWTAGLPAELAAWRAAWLGRLAAGPAGTPVPRAAERLAQLAAGDDLEAWRAALRETAADDQKPWPRGTKKLRKDYERFFADAAELAALLEPADRVTALTETWAEARPRLETLLALTAAFAEAFAAAKRQAAGVDFADLEQFALRLLADPATGGPSAAARELRHRFDLVCVDEYQDVNAAQDRVLTLVSREAPAGNRFLVGDVKQCIYRFRLADPSVLAGHAARPGALALTANFRSHAAILGFVNAAFARLFRPDVGGVAWDERAAPEFGAPEERGHHRARPEGRTELHLLRKPAADAAGDEAEEPAADEREARLIAARLRALRDEGFAVLDAAAGGPRPVAWRDMVVLLRAPGPRAEAYAQEFARAGVPLDAPRGGFLEAPEILDLVGLLRVLDNPQQDLPLAAVLRSPLGGLTLDELAAVRLALPDGTWWAALNWLAAGTDQQGQSLPGPFASAAEAAEPPAPQHGAGHHPELAAARAAARAKAARCLGQFTRWRRLAREGTLAQVLEVVLAETGYEDWLAAQPRGEARRANVRRLLGLTRQFDQHRRHGLFRFLRLLETQAETDAELEQAPAATGDAVRLLSIHRAKGLEFPVVVLARLGGKFNDQGEREALLLDDRFGPAPLLREPVAGAPVNTLARWRAAARARRERQGEELRLLYVAMTRPVEKLILTGAPPARGADQLPAAAPPGPLPTPDLLAAATPLHWLLPLMAELTGHDKWAEQDHGRGRLLDWTFHDAPPPAAPAAEVAAPAEAHAPFPDLAEVRARLAWRYPHDAAMREPAKAAVTALRRRWQAEAAEDEAAPRWARARGAADPAAAETGVAHHLFLERLDLTADASPGGLTRAADAMAAEGWLTAAQRARLDVAGLAAFFADDLGRRIRARAADVEREVPFTFRLDAADAARLRGDDAAAGPADEFQVVQGVADLVVRMPDEIWLVDFKTDAVPPAGVAARAAAYAPQLGLYALALEKIYGRPVRERWLYFLRARRAVRV